MCWILHSWGLFLISRTGTLVHFFSFLSSLDWLLTTFFVSLSFPTWTVPSFSLADFFVVSLDFVLLSWPFSFPLSFLALSESFFNLFVSPAFLSFRSVASFPFLVFFFSSSFSSFLDSCFSLNFLSDSLIASFTF